MKLLNHKKGDLGFLRTLIIGLIFLVVVLGVLYALWKTGDTKIALFFKSCSTPGGL
ncbi:MAG: hypothetical protein NT001_00120 [Candidatus Woesearchaeota archaeon]|nr:hypothetical protein [Candidatus Woesearchaeota archaeon]